MTAPMEDNKSRFKFLRWLDNQMDNRPFVTAVIVMILVVTPGFMRIQQIADDSKDAATQAKVTADAFQAREKRDTEKQIEENIASCQTRNTFQRNTRNKFDRFNDAIELAITSGVTDPARLENINRFMTQLRDSVETTPEEEDRDCNGDEVFDEIDYLP